MAFKRSAVRSRLSPPKKTRFQMKSSLFLYFSVCFVLGVFTLDNKWTTDLLNFFFLTAGRKKLWHLSKKKEQETNVFHTSFVCLGRDENGRQISKAMRWNPPEGMTPAKARKEAQLVAADWEAEQKEAFERQKAQQEGRKTDYIFGQFVDEVWGPLCVRDGSHRPSTVAMYTNILKVMRPHFEELLLSGICKSLTSSFSCTIFSDIVCCLLSNGVW